MSYMKWDKISELTHCCERPENVFVISERALLYSLCKLYVKDHFKDQFEAVFEHLTNDGQGGRVSIRCLHVWIPTVHSSPRESISIPCSVLKDPACTIWLKSACVLVVWTQHWIVYVHFLVHVIHVPTSLVRVFSWFLCLCLVSDVSRWMVFESFRAFPVHSSCLWKVHVPSSSPHVSFSG